MNEDLHDIDDLFKKELGSYTEAPPASVWDAVSHDLDKKQASLYKNKYKRLKRLSLLLLLLCFLGGAYIVIDNLNSRKGSEVTKASKSFLPVTHSNELAKPSASQHESAEHSNTPTNPLNNNNSDSIRQHNAQSETDARNASSGISNNKHIETANAQQQAVAQIKGARKVATDALGNSIALSKSNTAIATNKRNSIKAIKESGDPTTETNKKLNQSTNQNVQSAYATLHPLPQPVSSLSNNEQTKTFTTPSINTQLLLNKRKTTLLLSIEQQKNKTPNKSVAKSKSNTFHALSLSAFAAPNFTFDKFKDDHEHGRRGIDRHEARQNEHEALSLSAGLLMNYELSKKFSIQSGVSFTYSSTEVGAKKVYAKDAGNGHVSYELNYSQGYTYISPKTGAQIVTGDSAQTSGTNSKLMYISIPAAISYHIGFGKFSLLPTIGTGFNILLSGKAQTNLTHTAGTESTTSSTNGLKPAYVDGHIGIGIEYGLNRRLSIGLRPNARIALTAINKETPVKAYQNFLSLEAGIRLKL